MWLIYQQIVERIEGCPPKTEDIGEDRVSPPQTANPLIQEVGMKITVDDDTGVVTGKGHNLHHRDHRSVDMEKSTMRGKEGEVLQK